MGGAALGCAALTRPYTALAFALPFAMLAVGQIIHTRRWSALWTFAQMGLAGLGLGSLLLFYNHALTGQYTFDLYRLVWPYDRLGFGPGHGVLPGGHTLKIAFLNARADLKDLLTVLLGWPYLSWLPVLLGLALPQRRHLDWILSLPFVAIVMAHSAYWVHGSSTYGPRYYYEALPLVWLLAARGLVKLWQILSDLALKHTDLRPLVQIALAIMFGLNVLAVLPPRVELWRGLYGVTRGPLRQIEQLDIHNALILVNINHWGDYSELAWANNLALDSDLVFALDEGSRANKAVIEAYPGRRVFYLDGNLLIEMKDKP